MTEFKISRLELEEACADAFQWAEKGGYKTGSNYWTVMFTDRLWDHLNHHPTLHSNAQQVVDLLLSQDKVMNALSKDTVTAIRKLQTTLGQNAK